MQLSQPQPTPEKGQSQGGERPPASPGLGDPKKAHTPASRHRPGPGVVASTLMFRVWEPCAPA